MEKNVEIKNNVFHSQQAIHEEQQDISKMDAASLKYIKLVVFDVDGVLVPRGTKIRQEGNITTLETKKIQEKQIEQIKGLHDHGFLINISSGRSLSMLQEMFRKILDFVSITYENGSATWYDGVIHQHINSYISMRQVYPELLAVKHKLIKGFEPKEFIITIHCEDRVPEIENILGREKGIYCIWNGEAYDVGVLKTQTKGEGLKKCIALLGLEKRNVLAIGDNYNDVELLQEAGIAISADKSRLDGDYYIPLDDVILPAQALMERILAVTGTMGAAVEDNTWQDMTGVNA